MATISLNEHAPTDVGPIRFYLGHDEFELEGDAAHETDDQNLVNQALEHPWLHVEVSTPKAEAAAPPQDTDQTTPHEARPSFLDEGEE